MNSVDALDMAIGLVRKEQRRLTRRPVPTPQARAQLVEDLTPLGEALETLEALRELIAERVPSID